MCDQLLIFGVYLFYLFKNLGEFIYIIGIKAHVQNL